MRRLAILFLACGAVVAQEGPKARARALELEAEQALAEGRRGDALRLLKEAGDVREGKAAARKPNPGSNELGEMDAALGRGDAAAALAAGRRAQEALVAWAKDLEARERGTADMTVEERLERAERKLEELRRRLAR